jgi:hypothetical protein
MRKQEASWNCRRLVLRRCSEKPWTCYVFTWVRLVTIFSKIEQTLNMPDFPPKVKQAAHTLRLFGNEQLHADADKLRELEFFAIHEEDNVPTAEYLFRLLNVVADHAITVPKETEAWHSHETSKDEARREAKKTAAKNSSGKVPGDTKDGVSS